MVAVRVFTSQGGGGNSAGVVGLEESLRLNEDDMQRVATEAGFSETTFVVGIGADNRVRFRYFTPTDEVPFCGHATLGALYVLRSRGEIQGDSVVVESISGQEYHATFRGDMIFVRVKGCRVLCTLTPEQAEEVYSAFGVAYSNLSAPQRVVKVESGLRDILLPVNSIEELNSLECDADRVSELSGDYGVVGVHAYVIVNGAIHARNFAPLFGIVEECATGSSNCGLTEYLYSIGVIEINQRLVIVQGEAMGARSEIYTIRHPEDGEVSVGGYVVE